MVPYKYLTSALTAARLRFDQFHPAYKYTHNVYVVWSRSPIKRSVRSKTNCLKTDLSLYFHSPAARWHNITALFVRSDWTSSTSSGEPAWNSVCSCAHNGANMNPISALGKMASFLGHLCRIKRVTWIKNVNETCTIVRRNISVGTHR